MTKYQMHAHIQEKFGLTGQESSPVLLSGTTREDLYKLFADFGFGFGCEVGVQRARNAWLMFQNIPNLRMALVDPYRDHESNPRKWGKHHIKAKRLAHERMEGFNVRWIEEFSEVAAQKVPKEVLDYVYIDGEHSYDFVMIDLILWSRKVRPGGIVSGHDYNYRKPHQPKVTAAVNDYHKQYVDGPIYLTDNKVFKNSGDRFTSWFWIK